MVPALYSRVVTVLLSTVLVLVLLMLRDLQNLMHGGQNLLEESGQEVFEIIGKPRYYNKKYVDSFLLPYVTFLRLPRTFNII